MNPPALWDDCIRFRLNPVLSDDCAQRFHLNPPVWFDDYALGFT